MHQQLTSEQETRNREVILGDYSKQDKREHKDRFSRRKNLVEVLSALGRMWYEPDSEAFIHSLIERGLSESTIETYGRAMKSFYKDLSESDKLHDLLLAEVPAEATPEEQAAFINQAQAASRLAANYSGWPTGRVERRHRSHIRLTKGQASRWLMRPHLDTLPGLRDCTLKSTMLCLGLRDAEV
jgi:hypothetical protein